MTAHYMDILFTEQVRREQEAHGSRASYARMIERGGHGLDSLGAKEFAFLATRDSFYLASISASGWPYLQHRGGPSGFVKRIDDRTIGFADYRGNRQYVSLGNVATDDRVSLFFMDYPRCARLKMLGHMRMVDLTAAPELHDALVDLDYGATVERGFVIAIEGYDWNCPQHITPRYDEAQITRLIAPLEAQIAALTAEKAALQMRLA